MKTARLFSRLFSSLCVIALGLCLLTPASTSKADGDPTAIMVTFCAGCVAPTNTPCARTLGAGCFFLKGCTLCFCVPDPVLGGVACL